MKYLLVPSLLLLFVSPTAAKQPLLERDVLPILKKHCMGCHGGLIKKSELDLRTLPAMIRGGSGGPSVVKGKSHASLLWKRIANDDMPVGDREKLSRKEKVAIKGWIDAGFPTVEQVHKSVSPRLLGKKKHTIQQVAAAIDQHVDTRLKAEQLKPVGRSDDVEFLRRIYLDLAGRVPKAEEASKFLQSRDKAKRAKLIDQLLNSPDFGKQFGRTWRDWICPPELPSTGNAGIQPYAQANALGDWMGKKFVKGESWDKIARDMLMVKGEIKKQPQVIFFGLVGKGGRTTADGSARAVASLFMGVQLQCARCHDDPYRAWSQEEHWALTAFFGRTQGDFKKIDAGKGPNFRPGLIRIPKSAFKNSGKVVNAGFLRGKKYKAKNNGDLRKPFVDWLVTKQNPFFARAFVNRLWFYFFSRGIVNPIDDMRKLNPPSHPGLLASLSNEFKASGFDVKHLIRSICLSQAYQRTSLLPETVNKVQRDALTVKFGRMPLRVMRADMLYDSLKLAFGEKKLDLRTASKDSKVGMAAPVADEYLEFHRKFGTNEEDATDFTHGVAQMLTMINHPRLVSGSKSLDKYLKTKVAATETHKRLAKQIKVTQKPSPKDVKPVKLVQTVEWLYLGTLSRNPTKAEMSEAIGYLNKVSSKRAGLDGVLWMLINRTEFLLVR